MSTIDIDISACRQRQQRLLEVMKKHQLDLVVVTQIDHVQYLAGPRFPWTMHPAAALAANGKLTLVAPNKPPEKAAADEVLTYEAQWHSTLRNDQREASSTVLAHWLAEQPEHDWIGVEYSSFPVFLSQHLSAEFFDIEPALYRLRRRKDPDELARLKVAIAATGRMYEVARQIMKPGINELEMFNRLQATAVEHCGEMLTGTGNDYASGARGGPPRNRKAEDGELYVLDLGPAYRGYFSDNCRTIAVNGKPTEAQQTAWQHIAAVLDHVQKTVKPGKSCKQLFQEAEAMLKKAPLGVFNHHLGHGIGLFPHEGPHLNPNWDDTFEVGDVFTCEPGLYAPELRTGIRLENDYLVTENGVELLSDFPLEL
jgi:Xaa-Pro aminopeptidase